MPAIPEKFGRYEIVREIGHGAMGVVYEALDPTIGRKIALKAIRFDGIGTTADEAARRFKNEARAAGGLNHPNIVTVYDAGEDNGILYLAMEFIEGVTLEALLRAQRTIRTAQTIDMVRQICAGLDFAHAKGIVHRDIKPGNIMLAANGPVKITDFGIARAGEAMTMTGQVIGTPNYMSPEQVLGKTLDGRSDLFSVGVMLYEMVTGERPFEGQSITTIMYKIVHETPIPPLKLDSTIHPGLSAVIEKSLAKSAEGRFPNGAELARAVQNFESASVITTSTLGKLTGDFPSLADANAAHGARSTPSTAPPEAVPNLSPVTDQSAASPPPQTRIQQAQHWWQQLSPKSRKRAWIVFVLAAIFLYSKFERRSSRSEDEDQSKNQNPVSSVAPAPAAPVPPASDEQSGAQQSAPALVKRENAGGNQSTALMRINSNPPAAEVELDGKSTGKRTPTELQVGRGRHRVSVRMPGFQTSSVTVKVAGGEEFEYSPDLTVVLPNISVPNVSMPDISKLLSKDPQGQAALWRQWAGRQNAPGPKLVISSKPPGATILIDGKDSGQTSPAVIPVKPGKYHVRLELEGFEPAESDLTVGDHKPGIFNPALKLARSDQ
ncbi:MAG TPA: protein kinase [Terriglobales bacterium]|jgi:serine/threonine protein kinase|nr:protein kinase [Terriglobales bacterium]